MPERPIGAPWKGDGCKSHRGSNPLPSAKDNMNKDKLLGALYGALVGDACGCPYEFRPPEKIPPIDKIDMVPPRGYDRAWARIPVGTYTDDGAQTLILLDVLLSSSDTILTSLRTKLILWLTSGYMSVDNLTFDVGGQTRLALQHCDSAADVKEKLGTEGYCGNGSLMRCIPSALISSDLEGAMILASLQSLATHPNDRCRTTCMLYAGVAHCMLHDKMPYSTVYDIVDYVRADPFYEDISQDEINYIMHYQQNEPSGTGYVVDCFWSALWALHAGSSYEETIKLAISLGNDTDTTACVAGGLAGIKYGYNNIPSKWLDLLRGKDIIEPIANKLLAAHNLG